MLNIESQASTLQESKYIWFDILYLFAHISLMLLFDTSDTFDACWTRSTHAGHVRRTSYMFDARQTCSTHVRHVRCMPDGYSMHAGHVDDVVCSIRCLLIHLQNPKPSKKTPHPIKSAARQIRPDFFFSSGSKIARSRRIRC